MAVILEHSRLAEGVYSMLLGDISPGGPTGGPPGGPPARPGQFLMLREPGTLDPFLPRPLSLHDCEPDIGRVRLLYQAVGRGTGRFAALLPGQRLEVAGPYGNGFPLPQGDAVLIGGGIGIAPLLLLARRLREARPTRKITVYLGFREQSYCEADFSAYADELHVRLGGAITEDVDFSAPGTFYACGPTPMLRAAHLAVGNLAVGNLAVSNLAARNLAARNLAARDAAANAAADMAADTKLYVSLEKRMACGAGACFGCSIQTVSGNKRVCKDGPVFPSEEVFFDA